MSLTTFDRYQPYEQVDELAQATDMMGGDSAENQRRGQPSFWSDPTKGLIVLWVVVLALYWLMGFLFRGARS